FKPCQVRIADLLSGARRHARRQSVASLISIPAILANYRPRQHPIKRNDTGNPWPQRLRK
ncbi:MAG TPA: hypothetical protein VNO75_12660, partial [Gemmatimonadaceae bacterium]|nr:hypothetical protein [Gemmatimonadaceae bacterium]